MDGVDDLQLAFDTSDLAAELALAYFDSGVSATLKADGTPVTEADQAVERLLRETLSEARPEDAFVGEELGQLGESDRVWILDPIDGTSFFQSGDQNWRIHIALEVQGTREVALVTAPVLRRCWWAIRGGGPSSRHGHARTARRGASRSVRHRCLQMPCSMVWTTSPELVSHRVRLAHRRALSRLSSSFVAKSMPS